jgi:hypothetical protein
VYPHIAKYLSNICTGENAEYAVSELQEKAPRAVRDNIFDRDIISSMAYAVAWTIENSIRSKTGSISIAVDSISPGEENTYNVNFKVDNNIVNSVWINEYGIWRIRSFGSSASGDKTRIEKKEQAKADSERLHDNPFIMLSAGLAYPLDLGPAFGADLIIKMGKFTGFGTRGYFRKDCIQTEMSSGLYFPIKLGPAALTPFGDVGIGMMFTPIPKEDKKEDSLFSEDFNLGVSVRAGLCFTTAVIPGLYLKAAYQRNFYTTLKSNDLIHPDLIYIGVGYAF